MNRTNLCSGIVLLLVQTELVLETIADPATIGHLARRLGTPLYLLDIGRVVGAMDRLRDGIRRHYPDIVVAYSVKTNYLAAILRRVLAAGHRLEVVSQRELNLASTVGAAPQQLILNGAAKSEATLQYCYEHGIELNADSLEELEMASRIGCAARPFRLGIRVAATLNNGVLSRFGVDFDDPEQADEVRRLIDGGRIRVDGLHLHHSSRRDAASYCDRIDWLAEVAERLELTLQYMDIGGGIASTPPDAIAARLPYRVDLPEELADSVGRHARRRFGSDGPRLTLEPGIGVLADAMNYVTTVAAVKQRSGQAAPVAVCDGSIFDVNPLRSTIHPPCHVIAGSDELHAPAGPDGGGVRLYGGTCMEIDQLGVLDTVPHVGDLVVVTNVGAYSASLAPAFIVPDAPVYSVDEDRLVRAGSNDAGFPKAGL